MERGIARRSTIVSSRDGFTLRWVDKRTIVAGFWILSNENFLHLKLSRDAVQW